jgi:hypothetical protein
VRPEYDSSNARHGVTAARDLRHDRKVALKVLRPEISAENVAFAPKGFQSTSVVLVLGPPRPFGNVGELASPQLDKNFRDVPGVGIHGIRARAATKRPVAPARTGTVTSRD